MTRLLLHRPWIALGLVVFLGSCGVAPFASEECEGHPLRERLLAAPEQTLRVLVTLEADETTEAADVQSRVLALLEGSRHEVLRRFEGLPILALRVGPDAFCRLVESELVAAIQEDRPEPPGRS